MLENIRDKSQGWVAKVILGLVILTFAVAGLGSYTNSVDSSVAEVNGEKISQSDFDKAFQNQRGRMAQQYGDMFETLAADVNYMTSFKQSVLDSLINEKLVDQNSREMAIRVSDAQIKDTIRNMPEFQVDGAFDNNRYLAMINQAGFYQSSQFRDYLRVQMTRRQLSRALVSTEFNLPYQEEQAAKLQNQKRDIRFATIAAEKFKADVEVTDAEIDTYYQANQSQFINEEQVKVDYLALDVNEIAKSISVSDNEIQTYYQENIAAYSKAEQRKISHILVEFSDDESAAKTLIDSLLVRVKAGEDFAELAKEYSTDTYSGENGGDLDWFESGTMGDSFDSATLLLANVGDVSDVVTTDFGFHIIKLTDFKAEEIQALADVKEETKAKVSLAKAQDKFFELHQEMSRLSYEFPDSLDDAAGAINVEVATSPWLTKASNQAPFNDPKLIDAAFSDIVLTEHLNSDLIEVNDTFAVVLRINEYQEANVKPLTEVSEQIKTNLITQKASDKTQELAKELLASYKSGDDVTELLTQANAKFDVKEGVARYASEVDMVIARKAFTLAHPADNVNSVDLVTLNNGDVAIVEVIKVTEGEVTLNANTAQQQTSQLAQSAYQSFVQALAQNAEITKSSMSTTSSTF